MNNIIRINTSNLEEKLSDCESLICELDIILDKLDSKLKALAYNNNIWYSSTTINLYDHYNEQVANIKKLNNSYKNFFKSNKTVCEEYEFLENTIIKKAEKISSIKIL